MGISPASYHLLGVAYPVLCLPGLPSSPKESVFSTLGKLYPFNMPARPLVMAVSSHEKVFPPQKLTSLCSQHSGIPRDTQGPRPKTIDQWTSPQGPVPSISQESQMTESEATGLRGKRRKIAFSFPFITITSCQPSLCVSGLSFSFDRERDRGISLGKCLWVPGMPLHKGSLVAWDVPCPGLGPGDWVDHVALPLGSSWGV